ncbi:hypothetical protein [Nonomuraea sp. KM88]|uniref:hypothetical protein n=1 Tax=Nonomuraea sp. KM88 TaxID=3457427 RepID=UPI003FCE6A53
MIEVAPEMGRGKEKYWRITPGGFSFGDPPADPEAASAMEFLLDDLVRQRGAELARWRQQEAAAPEEWVRASAFGRRSLQLTPEETMRLKDEVYAVLERYRALSDGKADASPDTSSEPASGRVVVHFDVLPLGAGEEGA